MRIVDTHMIRVDSADGLRLEAVSERLRDVGYVVCDAPIADPTRFASFVDQLMVTDPLATLPGFELRSRDRFGDCPAQGLHSEFCLGPSVAPKFIALYCVEPASHGGETILADGVELLAGLSKATQQFFLDNRLRFEIVLPFATWKIMFGTHRAVLELSSRFENVHCRFRVDGVLHVDCVMSAIRPTSSGVPAFVNPLLHAF